MHGLPHKAAARQMGQPPSRGQIWISRDWRQETARTNRQVPQQGRQDISSLPNHHDFSKKCGDWPTASDLFRGVTPDVHRSARVQPSKDHRFRGYVASSRNAFAEGVQDDQVCQVGVCHNHSTRWARSWCFLTTGGQVRTVMGESGATRWWCCSPHQRPTRGGETETSRAMKWLLKADVSTSAERKSMPGTSVSIVGSQALVPS